MNSLGNILYVLYMYSTGYNLWTFTWFVHFELLFRLKGTDKIHTEGFSKFHSNIYSILFGGSSVFLGFDFFKYGVFNVIELLIKTWKLIGHKKVTSGQFFRLKGTVSVILSDLPVLEWHVWFKTILFKHLLDQ